MNTAAEETRKLRLRDWIGAHLLVSLAIFAIGVVAFLAYANSLTNRFAAMVRAEYIDAVVFTNLELLPAYALIALVHAWISFPIATRLRSAASSRSARLLHAAWTAPLVVAISFGPLSFVTSGPIDTLARIVARTDPERDLHAFLDSPLQLALTVAATILAVLATGEIALRLRTRLRQCGPRAKKAAASGAAIAVLGAAVALAPERASIHEAASNPRRSRPHVIILASDSLRSDHLGAHGYPRDTSPNLDDLARESIDFRSAHVATASTIESWTSFLTGRFPANHGIRYMFATRDQAERISSDPSTLPRVLSGAGYDTVVAGDWVANCFDVLDFGFAERAVSKTQNLDVFLSEVAFRTHALVPLYFASGYFDALVPNLGQATAVLAPDRRVDRFVEHVVERDRDGQPVFGVLFLSCTHLPFLSPHPFNRRFVDPSYRGPNRFSVDFDVDEFMKQGFADAQCEAERRHIVDLYDGGVAWFDSIVGSVITRLRDAGILDDSILIITSDHGEDLYEPGTTLGHGTNFFGGDQSTRIPLFVRLPKGEHGGRVVDAIVRGVDLFPTILDLVDVHDPRIARNDGVSLRPLIDRSADSLDLAAYAETCYLFFQRKPVIDGDDRSVVLSPADETLRIDRSFRSQFVLEDRWHEPVIRAKDRMIRTPRWKLIRIEGERRPIWRLFDMILDPTQSHDLSKDGLEVFPALRHRLERWIETGKAEEWPATLDGA